MIIILLKLKINSSFLTKIKEQNLKDLNWFSATKALKKFVTDKDNEMMKDLSEIFKMSIENLNTEISIKAADRIFVRSIRALKVFMTEISDSAENLKESEKKKAWMLS